MLNVQWSVAESEFLNLRSEFSERDVQFSLAQLQKIDFFFVGVFPQSARSEFALSSVAFMALRQVT